MSMSRMDFAKNLMSAVQNNDLHHSFGFQKEYEDLITLVLENIIQPQVPTMIAITKNDEDCNHYRQEGNQYFVTGDDDEAIINYTKSLAYAVNQESMALAFANRSASLYRKQLYRECLIDIDSALTYGYPEDKKNKLKSRAEKAIQSLQQVQQIKDQNMNDLPLSKNLDSSLQIDKNNELESKKKLSMIQKIIDEDDKSKGKIGYITTEDLKQLTLKISDVPRYVVEENETQFTRDTEAPAMIDGIKIAYSKKFGRYLVATKSFKSGSILLRENPFAYVAYPEKYYTHCHHCLARSYNLISCDKCPIAQYCSENCQKLDWEMAHSTECTVNAVILKLFKPDSSKTIMLTKIIRLLVISTKNGTEINKLQNDTKTAQQNLDERTVGFTDDGIFDSNSSRSALSLSTNLAKRSFKEITAFACISGLATIVLATQSNFFGKICTSDQLKLLVKRNDVKFCGALIFRSCLIESTNSFSIQQEPGVKAGSGLYVTASLMNHSCAPNTLRHFDGLTMITRATEPIKSGDQIFTSYGGGYQYMNRTERRSKMKEEYFFECDCQACVDNWPTYTEILRKNIGSISKTNKQLVKKLKPFRQRLLSNMYDIEAVKSTLDLLYEEVKMPCAEIVHAVQYLKSYYLGKFDLESHMYKL